MRRVIFDPSALSPAQRRWLDDWQARAATATEAVIEAWERGDEDLPFRNELWSELKSWLLENIFRDKCAYCEAEMGRFSGDAEHFRPKNKVTVRDPAKGRLVPVDARDPDGQAGPHPGYFWLAHELANLLPSCEYCNRRRGKLTQFPLARPDGHVLLVKLKASEVGDRARPPLASKRWPGWHYLHPYDLDALESPLLLNPVRDDPKEHLRFGDLGLVTEREGSERGRTSIEVYDLKDDKLRRSRQEEQETASNNYFMAMWVRPGSTTTVAARRSAAEAILDRYRDGEGRFSSAVLDYIELIRR